MPKLACPCGFVHNLTPCPDDGRRAIRDKDLEAYVQHDHNYSAGFDSPVGTPEREASDVGGRETVRMATFLYECPQCGRIMWRKERGDLFHIYVPEDEPKRSQALALACASEYEQVQKSIRAEAIRMHNAAARLVSQRMSSDGLRCPHCFHFSKEMKFIDRGEAQWAFFQCPSCARTFRLERFEPNTH